VSTRYHWFKGYKLYLSTTAGGIILSHVLTTANRNDAAVAPELLVSLKQWDIELGWAMPHMTAKRFVKQRSNQESIHFPINRRNSVERKDAYGRLFLSF
jgi:hypothetical protein